MKIKFILVFLILVRLLEGQTDIRVVINPFKPTNHEQAELKVTLTFPNSGYSLVKNSSKIKSIDYINNIIFINLDIKFYASPPGCYTLSAIHTTNFNFLLPKLPPGSYTVLFEDDNPSNHNCEEFYQTYQNSLKEIFLQVKKFNSNPLVKLSDFTDVKLDTIVAFQNDTCRVKIRPSICLSRFDFHLNWDSTKLKFVRFDTKYIIKPNIKINNSGSIQIYSPDFHISTCDLVIVFVAIGNVGDETLINIEFQDQVHIWEYMDHPLYPVFYPGKVKIIEDLNPKLLLKQDYVKSFKDLSLNQYIVNNFGSKLTNDRNNNCQSAIALNGKQDFLSIDNFYNSELKNGISISLWAKTDSFDLQKGFTSFLCALGVQDVDLYFRFGINKNKSMYFGLTPKNGNFKDVISPTPIHDSIQFNNWNCFGMVWNSKELSFYLNGKKIATPVNLSELAKGFTKTTLYIGSDKHGLDEYIKADLDDIFIYYGALQQNQMDSIYKLKVPKTYTIFQKDTTICIGDFIDINNQRYFKQGIYNDTLLTNCNEILSYNLDVIDKDTSFISKSICPFDTINLNGEKYFKSGNYFQTFNRLAKCDSISKIEIKEVPYLTSLIEANVCKNSNYFYKGQNYSPGKYEFKSKNSNMCDSLITLIVTEEIVPITKIESTICEGDNYSLGDSIFYLEGDYSVLFSKKTSGCDSIVNLKLNVIKKLKKFNLDTSLCVGQQLKINNNIYNNLDTIKLLNYQGCDSITVVNLSFHDTIRTSINKKTCPGSTVVFQGLSYTNGDYKILSTDPSGCLLLTTLRVEDYLSQIFNIDTGFCKGSSINLFGINYSQASKTEVQFTNTFGCDSIYKLNIQEYDEPILDLGNDVNFPCESKSLILKPIINQGNLDSKWIDLNGNRLGIIGSDSLLINNQGVYIFEAINNHSCIKRDTIQVFSENKPNKLESDIVSPSCSSGADGSIGITNIEGGTPPYRYILQQDGLDIRPIQTNNYFNLLQSGNYQIEVVDSKNCRLLQQVSIVERNPPSILVDIDTSGLFELESGASVVLRLNLYNQIINPVSYTWSSDNGSVQCSINCEPSINATINEDTKVIVCVKDKSNCTSCDSLQLIVKQKKVKDPDIITDESDGFKFKDLDDPTITGTELWIATRTGTIVYNHKNYQCCGNTDLWKGQNQDGSKLPTASYYYVFKIHYGTNKKDEIRKGTVTWIR